MMSAAGPLATQIVCGAIGREWDGPAALPPPTALRVGGGLSGAGAPSCLAGPPFAQSPCLIGIEAGMATHYVARELAALGHDVKQVPPAYAKPFRQGHKNDFRDALAVAEAVQRPTTRFVPPKSNEQLDLQAPHRVR